MHIIRRLLTPGVLVPTLLSAAFLVVLLNLADAGKVAVAIAVDAPRTVVPVVLLTLLYLVAKGLQWRLYLGRLGIRPAWRKLLIPYVGGELGSSLPMGVYLENYLLKGVDGAAFGRSSSATIWMLMTEIVLCLLALLAVGVPGWPWVRPLALAVLLGLLLVGWLFFRLLLVQRLLRRWQPRRRWLQVLVAGAQQFLEGGRRLFAWQTFLAGIPLTALYLGAYVAALYIVGAGLIPRFEWRAALAAFTFSLVVVLLISVLPHLGSVEAAGMAVLLQFGVSNSLGLGIFLTVRVLATGTVALVCALVFLTGYREVGRALHRLSGAPQEEHGLAVEDWQGQRAAGA
jgi:uncharacterized membrane protein YbhN (UPF0104 family)